MSSITTCTMTVFSWTLTVLLLSLFVAGTYTSVAPQDADPFCLNLPSRPATNPRQVILLDTAHYRSQDLVTILTQSRMWISLKFLPGTSNQKWGDHVQSNCEHNLLSCYFANGDQNNWLITQYINISTTEVTDLNVSATFATSTTPCIAGECSQNVPVRVYWTNTPEETERNDTSNYNKIATRLLHITNDGQKESDHEDVEVPSNITGLYLALVDEGTCVSITRLVVSYNVCPEQTLNLIIYPQTIAPTTRIISLKMVPASCVDGASMTGTTMLVCTVGGLWGAPDPPADTCQCDPGYQMIGVGSNTTCEACPPQQFKSSRSNTESCHSCPRNSYANTNGSNVCMCSAGYYRTSSETSDEPCTGPPSAPRSLTVTKISQLTHASVKLTWSPPSITGDRADLKYVVTYVKGAGAGSIMFTVETTYTNITLNDLEFSTLYRITVEAVNGVSMELGSSINRTVTISVTTLGQPPSAPLNLVLESRTLSWDQPTSTFGEDLLRYEILVSSTEDVSNAEVLRNVSPDATSYTLTDEDLQGKTGSLYIWVRAVSSAGGGQPSTRQLLQIAGDSMSIGLIIGASAVAVFGISLCLVICLIVLIVVIIQTRKNQKSDKYVQEGVPNVGVTDESGSNDTAIEMGVLEEPLNSPVDNTKYVDPRNYHSPYEALSVLRVNEIPPKELKFTEPLGEGEFGLVYKGVWNRDKKSIDIAVKTLRGSATPQDVENFLMEASVMRQFHNPNVVLLYGVVCKVEPIMIIMEFMKNGSLDHYLKSNMDRLGAKRQLKMAHGVASGMAYLASKEYVHRDLAARNILVSQDEKCKVADFGLARVMKENVYEVQRGGRIPVRWTAPEAIAYREFTSASDVWSFGVLLWEIMSYGQTPYDDWDNHMVLERVDRGERLRKPRSCPDDVYFDIMLRCWEADRVDRPTFLDLRKMLDVKIFGCERPPIKPKQTADPVMSSPENIPVHTWLDSIKMDRYTDNFVKAGYKTMADCTNLTKEQLQKMGITARGHLHKITSNIPSTSSAS